MTDPVSLLDLMDDRDSYARLVCRSLLMGHDPATFLEAFQEAEAAVVAEFESSRESAFAGSREGGSTS